MHTRLFLALAVLAVAVGAALVPGSGPAMATGGTTERVSVASDGTEGNGDSRGPSISADGRYVAFQSIASHLVPGDTNDTGDVFVHDRENGDTSRVSLASDGTEANAPSGQASISADGRYVAFGSSASNLVPGDTNGTSDIFVHDRCPAGKDGCEPGQTPKPTPTTGPPTATPGTETCPVVDITFCDFVLKLKSSTDEVNIATVLAVTVLTEQPCSFWNDLEEPPFQGLAPAECEGAPPEHVPECVEWSYYALSHPNLSCLTMAEYAEALGDVAVIGISHECPVEGCQGTIFLADPTQPLSGDSQSDVGVTLRAVQSEEGWLVTSGGGGLVFYYLGYPEHSWPPTESEPTPAVTPTATGPVDTPVPPTAAPTATPTPTPRRIAGDANCTGAVNAIDAALVLQLTAGLIASVSCPENADVNLDGTVDPLDAALMLQYDAGLVEDL